jgi:hypothetical protein
MNKRELELSGLPNLFRPSLGFQVGSLSDEALPLSL